MLTTRTNFLPITTKMTLKKISMFRLINCDYTFHHMEIVIIVVASATKGKIC